MTKRDMLDAHKAFARSCGQPVEKFNPAVSEKQRRYMGAALARKRAGTPRKGDPKLSEADLADFARRVRRV